MKKSLLTTLRSKNTSLADFRNAADKLSFMLAAEIAATIKEKSISIETPFAKAHGSQPLQTAVLIPILRAGVALLPAFMHYFDRAKVGFIGLFRDQKTKKPHLYYEKVPPIGKNELVLLLDPMIATGGSALHAVEKVIEKGADSSNIHIIGLVATPEGIEKVEAKYADITFHVVAPDEKLNEKKYITPGLGDFGDRYFGTEGL